MAGVSQLGKKCSEEKQVLDHRRDFFREILVGTPADTIESLVYSDISPHDLKKFIDETGCPPELAAAILL